MRSIYLTILVYLISKSSYAGDPFDASIPLDRPMKIAITIDDLPSHNELPKDQSRLDIAQKILTAFHDEKFGIPEVYGFVNGEVLNQHPEDLEVLKIWIKAGYPLGNHTFTHMDLHKASADQFIADIEKTDKLLAEVTQGTPFFDRRFFFRYPFLNEGNTLQKRDAVRSYFEKTGYRIAYTTVDYFDWAFNDAYLRCVAKNKTQAIETLKKNTVDAARRQLRRSQLVAKKVFGQDIPHILLVHIGAFDSIMLPEVLNAYKNDGVEFIKLEDALNFKLNDTNKTQVYSLNPNIAFRDGYSFLDQMAEARKIDVPGDDPKYPLGGFDKICK